MSSEIESPRTRDVNSVEGVPEEAPYEMNRNISEPKQYYREILRMMSRELFKPNNVWTMFGHMITYRAVNEDTEERVIKRRELLLSSM